MKKVLFTVAAAVLACSTLFMGCSKKNDGIKLEMYYYKQENQEGLKNIVKAFEAANPGITVDMLIIPNDADAAMSSRAAQGKLPDILQMQSYSRVQEYAEKGYLVDLTNTDVMSKVVDSAKPSVTYNGKQYALPMDYAGIGIIYNKDLFEQYGLSAPATARELQNVCRTLKANGIVPFSGLLKENWSAGHFITLVHTALLQDEAVNGTDFVNAMNEGKASYGDVDTDELFSILDFYRDNMAANATEMDGGAQQQSFAKGESAMIAQGLWTYADTIKINPSLNCGFVPYPVYNDADKNVFYADVDSTFGLSSQSSKEKQEAAMKFLEFLSTEQGSKMWVSEYKLTNSFKGGDFKELGVPYDELMQSVAEKGANPWLFSQYPSEVFEDSVKNGAQQYMMKTIDADSVIANIDAQWAEKASK